MGVLFALSHLTSCRHHLGVWKWYQREPYIITGSRTDAGQAFTRFLNKEGGIVELLAALFAK